MHVTVTVTMTWLDRLDLDPHDVDSAVSVQEAGRRVDAPHWPMTTRSSFVADLTNGWDGDPPQTALLREGERAVGLLQVTFPSRDNRHLGWVDLTVDPAARGRGIGRTLFDAAVDRIRAEGRSLIVAESWDRPGSVGFAKAMGLDRGLAEVQRHQDLRRLDWAALDRLGREAQAASGDYVLTRLTGPVPDELVERVVELTKAINDAPNDDLDLEDEVFDADRLRAFDAAQARAGRRVHRVMAQHRATGDPAGHTVVAVDVEQPWYAIQEDTSVVRAHRGHRLGLRLKLDMLSWLRTEEPQLDVLSTWNAASNEHMIAVNEALGYHVVAQAIAWQRGV